jgi:hypothetical protein
MVILLFHDENLRRHNNSDSIRIDIVIIDEFDLLHHLVDVVVRLMLAVVRRRLQELGVLPALLQEDIVLMTADLKVLGLWGLHITVN